MLATLVVLGAFLCGVIVGGCLVTAAVDAQRAHDERRDDELHLHDQIDRVTRLP